MNILQNPLVKREIVHDYKKDWYDWFKCCLIIDILCDLCGFNALKYVLLNDKLCIRLLGTQNFAY